MLRLLCALGLFAMSACVPLCTPNLSAACACADGRVGAQVCASDGTFLSCSCLGPLPVDGGTSAFDGGLDDIDAGAMDGGEDVVDAGAWDAGVDVDAGAVDAGSVVVVDAGTGVVDAGALDSGVDAGRLDAGVPDGGQVDAGAALSLCLRYAAEPVPSGPTVRFVSPTGSDSATGLTPTTAWATPTRVASGQTIVFLGGTYRRVPPLLRGGGNPGLDHVTFMAMPGETPVLDAENAVYDFIVGYDATVHDITVRGLTLLNYTANESGVVVFLDGSHHWTVECSTFRNIGDDQSDHAIYPGGGATTYLTVRNNRFQNITGGGVHSFHANGIDHVEIHDNVFIDCKWGVLTSNEGQADWNIHHNSFYAARAPTGSSPTHTPVTGQFGVAITGYDEGLAPFGVTGLRVHHNASMMVGGARWGFIADSIVASGVSEERDNVWYATSGGCAYSWGSTVSGPYPCFSTASAAMTASSRAQGDVFADPGFVNAAAGDFRLVPGGAAATAGAGARL